MIIHRHADGSEGREYQVGDEVVINKIISSDKWLRRVIGKTGTVSALDTRDHWRIRRIDVRHSPEWGSTSCLPWMLEPTANTPIAQIVIVEPAHALTGN